MSLPFVLLLSMVVVASGPLWSVPLPGTGTTPVVLAELSLLLVPTMLAVASLRSARRELLRGRPNVVPPRAMLAWSALASPGVLLLLDLLGGYRDLADRLAFDDGALALLLGFAPVFVAELPRLAVATMAQLHVEMRELLPPGPVEPSMLPHLRDLVPQLRARLGWPVLMLGLVALLSGLLALLQRFEELEAFVMATSVGMVLAGGVLLVLALLSLPQLFRLWFGVHGDFPPGIGEAVRATAAQLGFPPGRVFVLPTGRRSLNALLVAPLPIGRFLCITDGLVHALDRVALSGVVAHEVGHARLRHPQLLAGFVLAVSVAILAIARLCMVHGSEPALLVAVTAVPAVLTLVAVRQLMRRFELEADAVSVETLGAGPCSQALLEAMRHAMPQPHSFLRSLLSMHPDESERVQRMHRHQADPGYRAAFAARGRRVRQGLLATVLVSLTLAWFGFRSAWPIEYVAFRLGAGDVVGAHLAAPAAEAALTAAGEPVRDEWQRTRTLLDAAFELAPAATDWPSAKAAFAERAWRRGELELLARGPAAAEPWLALHLAATSTPSDLERAIYAYCRAAFDEQPERVERLRRHIQQLGPPESLRAAFGD